MIGQTLTLKRKTNRQLSNRSTRSLGYLQIYTLCREKTNELCQGVERFMHLWEI